MDTNTRTPADVARTPTGTTPPTTDALLSTIQERLLNNSGIVSSEATGIERAITNSINAVEKGRLASEQRIVGQFGREIESARADISSTINTQLEGGRGFAVNIGALREVVRLGDKTIQDLEQRKQELLLMNDAQSAQKITELQLKEYEMQQNARDKVFNQLLSAGNFAVNLANQQTQARAQSFNERSVIAKIATEFGIPVYENDTIDTITARAAPVASTQKRLELESIRANINRANAETQKALSGSGFSTDDTTLSAIASTIDSLYRKGQSGDAVALQKANALYGNLIEKGGASSVAKVEGFIKKQREQEFSWPNVEAQLNSAIQSGKSRSEILLALETNKAQEFITQDVYSKALKVVDEKLPKPKGILESIFGSRQAQQTPRINTQQSPAEFINSARGSSLIK